MEIVNTKIFEREITHTGYNSKRKTSRFAGNLPFEIHETLSNTVIRKHVGKLGNEDAGNFTDHKFISQDHPNRVAPLIIGGVALLIIIMFTYSYIEKGQMDIFWKIVYFLNVLILLFSIMYYFTVPKKRLILDREKCRITLPGYFWKVGYTMPFKSVRIGWGGGATGSPSPDSLIVALPNKLALGRHLHLYGGNYFQELSYLVWYMDRNRPLPPRNIFDPYRKENYQRRKAEGFPPPLFVSQIQTPEAKTKWQKERDKHWKESMVTNEEGKREWQLWQSEENIALHGKWQEVVPQ